MGRFQGTRELSRGIDGFLLWVSIVPHRQVTRWGKREGAFMPGRVYANAFRVVFRSMDRNCQLLLFDKVSFF